MATGDSAAASSGGTDMVAGGNMESTLSTFNADFKTMNLSEGGKDYKVSDNTVCQGTDNAASTADEFWSSNHTNQKVTVEGKVTDGDLSADKITLQ